MRHKIARHLLDFGGTQSINAFTNMEVKHRFTA
jgi:hypothetical protein